MTYRLLTSTPLFTRTKLLSHNILQDFACCCSARYHDGSSGHDACREVQVKWLELPCSSRLARCRIFRHLRSLFAPGQINLFLVTHAPFNIVSLPKYLRSKESSYRSVIISTFVNAMAIFDHFEASIQVDDSNVSAPEYDDDELKTAASKATVPTVAKYIEVQAGKSFALRLRLGAGHEFAPTSNSIAWSVRMDGQEVKGIIMGSMDYRVRGFLEAKCGGVETIRNGVATSRRFIFRDINISKCIHLERYTSDSLKHRTILSRTQNLSWKSLKHWAQLRLAYIDINMVIYICMTEVLQQMISRILYQKKL